MKLRMLLTVAGSLAVATPLAAAESNAREDCAVAYVSCIKDAAQGAYVDATDNCIIDYYSCVRRKASAA